MLKIRDKAPLKGMAEKVANYIFDILDSCPCSHSIISYAVPSTPRGGDQAITTAIAKAHGHESRPSLNLSFRVDRVLCQVCSIH